LPQLSFPHQKDHATKTHVVHPHGFLLHGPSRVGKTTVARIIASELGCKGASLIEIDAASHSGVDDMRAVANRQTFQALDGKAQVTIIDECHKLSSSAWNALLKPIEEAPDGFYWIFCTTEPAKVPKTVKTRCHEYLFSDVTENECLKLIRKIAKKEKIKLDDESFGVIVKAAQGSPRQALVSMSACRAAKNVKEVQELLRAGFDHADVIELCRYLLFAKGATFGGALDIVVKFKDSVTAETARLTILNYSTSVLLSRNTKNNPNKIMAVMDEFSEPFFQAEKMAPVLIALGRLLLGD